MRKWTLGCLLLLLVCGGPLLAQQTGSISGRVTVEGGEPLPGVTVEATSPVLPQARTTTTNANGEYRLPLLPPGEYELTFSMADMAAATRSQIVQLDQLSVLNVELGPEALSEEISVLASLTSIDPTSTELKTSMDTQLIAALPIGQDYRSMLKLIPGVQVSQDVVRGPSAGGNGQDNVYKFDGVNVTLPLFGTLAGSPSGHDIDQISMLKGGAKAIDFNRSGGFTIDSITRSGTSDFHGQVGFTVQSESLTSERRTGAGTTFEEDREWLTGTVGGPIVGDKLLFYASAQRRDSERPNRANLYGDVPDFEGQRDEYFGKLTYAPLASVLVHGSYRHTDEEASGLGASLASTAGSTSSGSESELGIAIAEGSWILDEKSFISAKYTDFDLTAAGRPDNLLNVPISLGSDGRLDVNALDRQGLFQVPTPLGPTATGAAAFNAFIAPIIDRYGFLQNGVRTGGGVVGGASELGVSDFLRESYQLAYDRTIGSGISHDLHFGYQFTEDEEVIDRTSNGWGLITVVGGRSNTASGQPIFFRAAPLQTGLVNVSGQAIPVIRSGFETHAIEINDTMKWGNWAFNAGLLATQDTFFGQGLREAGGNVSGFALARGRKYEMYQIDWEDALQPRLGAVWAYDGANTVFASVARYVPAASSLPRAASWDRNLASTINVDFDAQGRIIQVGAERGSSGKLFADDLDPRTIDEFLVGSSRQVTPRLVARANVRYRYGYNFWEDTQNNARVVYNPPAGVPRELYIPDLGQQLAELPPVASGTTSYVIAELDGAFTKYWEATLESEWRGNTTYVRGSYTWSHYYGNFDQDNTTQSNDDNIFIGSSFVADGGGRQIWDKRYGNLRGDRRHQLKVLGYHTLPWNASLGAYAFYQSGQPWEIWDVEVYRALLTATGSASTSSTSRFAESAGSRETPDHYQLDLNYTQEFRLTDWLELGLRADVFNVFDQQTGYNVQNQIRLANFNQYRNFWDPRRIHLGAIFRFG